MSIIVKKKTTNKWRSRTGKDTVLLYFYILETAISLFQ